MKHNNHDGFTLVEMAMVLILFGLISSTVMVGLSLYLSDRTQSRTIEAMKKSKTAVFLFQVDQRHYPCPADPTLGPGDAGYGVADCTGANIITMMGRDTGNDDGNGDPCDANGDVPILIGALPFATMQDPDGNINTNDAPYEEFVTAHSMDGWGSKLTYAVTRDLTDYPGAPSFDHEAGGICIIDENNVNLLDIAGTAHAVIVSHGENAKGSFSETGGYIDDCVDLAVPGEATAMITLPFDERENCDHEEASVESISTFMVGVRNNVQADYNDDYVKFIVSNVSSIWTYTDVIFNDNGTPGDPTDDFQINQVANTNGGNIGLGVDEPKEQLHLQGDIQADEMHVEGLCDSSGADCMPPEVIAGEVADMKCPAGQVVTTIEQNKVTCINPFPASAFTPCPPGEFMTGISNVSGPICTTP